MKQMKRLLKKFKVWANTSVIRAVFECYRCVGAQRLCRWNGVLHWERLGILDNRLLWTSQNKLVTEICSWRTDRLTLCRDKLSRAPLLFFTVKKSIVVKPYVILLLQLNCGVCLSHNMHAVLSSMERSLSWILCHKWIYVLISGRHHLDIAAQERRWNFIQLEWLELLWWKCYCASNQWLYDKDKDKI